MPLLGIIFIILSSVLTGALITGIFRERNSNFAANFAAGFLSLFALLFVCLLAGLKLDLTLQKLSVLYIGAVSVASVLGLIFVASKKFGNYKIPKINGEYSLFLFLAVIIAAVSYVVLAQSFVNDDLIEIVYTSLSTDTYYEYAAFTGNPMTNGLPIFNKIYVMPMFFTIMCRIFSLNPHLLACIFFPLIVYVCNLMLVNEIGKYINISSRPMFMSFYLLWLVCGTYLPSLGIPMTLGYAILRNGYSGYSVFFGILVPLFVLLLLKKKYFKAVCSLIVLPALVRADRIFFAAADLVNTYHALNLAGKLLGVYFISVIAVWVLKQRGSGKTPWPLFLVPGYLVSYTFIRLYTILNSKKEKILLAFGIVIVLLSCTNFVPFAGAESLLGVITHQQSVSECLKLIKQDYPNPVIYSNSDFMATVRQCSGNTRVIYGRDFDSTYLVGLDYEEKPKDIRDYSADMLNQLNYFDYLVREKSREDLLKSLVFEGVNVVVFPGDFDTESVRLEYEQAGFEYKGTYGNFCVFGND